MVKKILIMLYLLPVLINAQNNTKEGVSGNSLFLFTAGYRLPVSTGRIINSGHGPYIEAGINPAYFFSKKAVVGIFAGWSFKDNLWSTSFDDGFLSDYHKSVNTEHGFSALDSSVIAASYHVFSTKNGKSLTMPGCEMNSFHNYSLYYGVFLKLPADRSPALKLYTGSTRTHYQGNGYMITTQKDYNILQLRRKMYGAELMITDPFYFFKIKKKYLKYTGLSIYYEYCDMYISSLYFDDGTQQTNIPLKRIVSTSFLNKYRHDHAFGIKLSYSVL